MIIRSFGKINIGLRILSKRNDGFHNIETIFYPIKLYDEIKISLVRSRLDHNSVRLHCNKYFIPVNRENLCYRAIEKFFVAFFVREHFEIDIEIDKKIPVGGGLGGGSSNAASILRFLIKYFNIDIEKNREKIMDVALSLGSDVPFFLITKPCFAEGRGEVLRLLKDFKLDYDILIVNPNIHVSTKWAYENLNLPEGFKGKPALKSIERFNEKEKDKLKNDFEDAVFWKYEELRNIKDELLKCGSVFASMSGSGATMYGLFRRGDGALKRCHDEYSEKGYFTFISAAG